MDVIFKKPRIEQTFQAEIYRSKGKSGIGIVKKLEDSLGIPKSYENISKVVKHNEEIGPAETGGEFSLEDCLDFYDVPNESLKILDELSKGDYKNAQRMMVLANGFRNMLRNEFNYSLAVDHANLGELIAYLALLREGKTPQDLNIEPDSFFKKYAKLFSFAYPGPDELTQSASCGIYHTHPFKIKDKPEGRDLTTSRFSLVLNFDLQKFDGIINLYLVDLQSEIYPFRVDMNKKHYEKIKD
jgi:hypothetical protein